MGDLTMWDLILVPAAMFAAVFTLCWINDWIVTHGKRRQR